MRKVSMIALLTSALLATALPGRARALPIFDVVTQWTAPFEGWWPFQMAVAGGDVFYLTSEFEQHLGRLNVATGRFTEWSLPYPSTSPGDVVVRPSDGAVFVTGLPSNEIAQFDVATQVLRRWPLPIALESAAPRSLTFDQAGGVVFTGYDDTFAGIIGRLDTATGTLTTWRVPASVGDVTRVVATPSGRVFFNDNVDPYSIGALDMSTGTFTSWPISLPLAFALATDPAGNVYVQEYGVEAPLVARFVPATGRLTEWTLPAAFNDGLVVAAQHLFVASIEPTGMVGLALSTSGTESVLEETTAEVVIPTTSTLSPAVTHPAVRRARGAISRRLVRRQSAGPFSVWSIPEQPHRMVVSGNALFYAGASAPVIGRLTD